LKINKHGLYQLPYGDNLLNNTCAINPWWITGFADAEGSFQIIIRHDTRLQFN
jgi:hypothetical protein